MLAMCSPASAEYSAHSIGYIGCSNSRDSVSGYHAISSANRMWPAYATGGGRIDLWATASSSYWTSFQGMVITYGTPKAVWVQLCENVPLMPNTYAQVVAMLEILKSQVPTAIAYISAINGYHPAALCPSMGPLTPSGLAQGNADTNAWAAQAVIDGLAQAGPSMGPLTPTLVTDDCHPNQAGMGLLGQQLQNFFDTLH
jgi:hypothetical protein